MSKNKKKFQQEVGFVVGAKGYLLSLRGLPSAKIDDLIVDEDGNYALVRSLNEEYVDALLLSDFDLKPGTKFYLRPSSEIFSFGEHLFGRTINALGAPIDGKGSFPQSNQFLELDVVASGISFRKKIKEQFYTGISFVDTLVPLGKGQRQLVYGALGSGKMEFLREVVINQNSQNMICIYAVIGRPADYLQKISSYILRKSKSNSNNIIMAATSEESSSMISIAPSVAFLLAEYFQQKGNDVLLILDDLGIHAKHLREISLLEGRLPGRESYPGDIFYQHAFLMERAGYFNKKGGGGSITLFPVLETQVESYTDLISTNLIACTDGHLSFSSSLWQQGYFPSILEDESVTRVGRNTQNLIQKQLTQKILSILVDYKKQKEYTRFKAQVSEETQKLFHQAELIKELIKQDLSVSIPFNIQIIMLSLPFTPFLLERDKDFLEKNKKVIIETIKTDSRLEEAREMSKRDVSFNDFIIYLKKQVYVLERVCL